MLATRFRALMVSAMAKTPSNPARTLLFLLFGLGIPAFLYVAAAAPGLWGPRMPALAIIMGLVGLVAILAIGWGRGHAWRAGMDSREFIILIITGSALAVFFGSLAINDLGARGRPSRTVELPIAEQRRSPRLTGVNYSVRTLEIDDAARLVWLQVGEAEFPTLRIGNCFHLKLRQGALGIGLREAKTSGPCAAERGMPPPAGPAAVVFDPAAPEPWRWGWLPARPGANWAVFERAIPVFARAYGKPAGGNLVLHARVEADGRVSDAGVATGSGSPAFDAAVVAMLKATPGTLASYAASRDRPMPAWVELSLSGNNRLPSP